MPTRGTHSIDSHACIKAIWAVSSQARWREICVLPVTRLTGISLHFLSFSDFSMKWTVWKSRFISIESTCIDNKLGSSISLYVKTPIVSAYVMMCNKSLINVIFSQFFKRNDQWIISFYYDKAIINKFQDYHPTFLKNRGGRAGFIF